MNTATRLTAFAAGLAAVFAASIGIGNAVGAVGSASGNGHQEQDVTDNAHADMPATAASAAVPGGLSASQDGYLLQLDDPLVQPSRSAPFTFVVRGPDGDVLTRFEPSHDKDLHLIVARRDLSLFEHAHPVRDVQGRWSIPLVLTEPGAYKVFADFVPAGRKQAVILAADVTVPGTYSPVAPSAPTTTAVVDGYTVSLAGELVPGTESKLTLSVSKNGKPVQDLQPYLAAYGHLVALRASDLAYLHVHPDGEEGGVTTKPGPDITFFAGVPTSGTYRLFLDFKHNGVVRTAAFTASARTAMSAAPKGDSRS